MFMIKFLRLFEQERKFMKQLKLIVPGLILLVLFAGAADAQKRTTRRTTAKKPAATKPAIVPPLDVRAAREKVDIQLADVNRFLDKLGPVAQGLEDADAAIKAGQIRPKIAANVEANKDLFVKTIRNVRAGLSTLESEFRTKPSLQKYLPAVQGITDLAGQSEDQAIAGKFVASKEPLRTVAKKLTDTLALLPR